MTLSELSRRANDGSREAHDELVVALRPYVVRGVRLVMGRGPAAEDAAQEAWVEVARGIPGVRDPDAIAGWALRIAMRRAVREARREAVWQRARTLMRAVDEDTRGDPEPMLYGYEVRGAFGALPPRRRAIAVLRLHYGLSEAETADVLGCSIGTVKSGLNAARARLQKVLVEMERGVPEGGRDGRAV